MTHRDLYDAALEAIRTLESDTSVEKEVTADDLESLIEEIEQMLEGLKV